MSRTTPSYLHAYPEDGWYDNDRSRKAALPERYGFAWGLSQARHRKPEEDPVHLRALWFRVFPPVHGRSLLIYISQRPVERILSLYYFSRTRDPAEYPIYRVAHEMDLAGYLRAGFDREDIKTYLWNQQAWQLACGWNDPQQRQISNFTDEQILERAKAHLMEFHYIGFAESFAVDSKAILANLNVPVPESLVPANVTPQRPHRNDLPAATIRLAEELTCLDAALYEHAKDLCRQGLGRRPFAAGD